MAIPAGHRPLPGSEHPQVPGSTSLGRVKAAERIAFTLLLRPRPGSPDLHGFDHWQNTPPHKRKFLSAEEFARTYGAADEDLRAALDFLASKDLRVTEADAGRRRVLVEGTASEINSAFGITLNLYRAPHHFVPRPPLRRGRGEAETRTEHEYRGFEGPIHLPAALIKVVVAVVGLDNRKLGGPAGTGTG